MVEISLRDITDADVPIFFQQQLDESANYMAAFTSAHPGDRHAFDEHWRTILADNRVKMKTIIYGGQVAGHVSSFIESEFDKREVTYWIGKEYWGRGIATTALTQFLSQYEKQRPIYARVVDDNVGSKRVLEK